MGILRAVSWVGLEIPMGGGGGSAVLLVRRRDGTDGAQEVGMAVAD